MTILEQSVSTRYKSLNPTFDERSRRFWAAAEALSAGRGGVISVSRATGISRTTIYQGIKDLKNPQGFQDTLTRTRKPGGGRKKTVDINPQVRNALEALVEPITRGDPESPCVFRSNWTPIPGIPGQSW